MMKYGGIACALLALLLLVASPDAQAQPVKWSVGGNMGLSITSNTYATNAGFHFGPMAEVIFNRSLAVGTEFNINTQTGTPIEWATYFKYYIDAKTTKIKPYVDGGFGLFFPTGGPYFGIRFGGGVGFLIAKNLYVGPDLQLGPVFTTYVSTFYIVIRGGMRYEIP
jgi:hypothetical protein